MTPLKKLTGYEQKQEFCRQIAKGYEELYAETFSLGVERVPEEFEDTADRVMLNFIARHVYQSTICGKEATKYKELAKSKRLYFVKRSKLERILNVLELVST
jgi:hypothetical protein